MQVDREVKTTCPYCGVGCGLKVELRGQDVVRMEGDFDSPVNHGNLCVKGRFGYDFIYHPARVTVPLIRREIRNRQLFPPGRDPRELFREASWDEALDLVATQMAETVRQSGPDALACFCCAKATNEENYLLQKLFRQIVGTNNVDHCTRLCHAASVVALQEAIGSSAMSNTAAEVIESDVFIVTGSNTAETHPIIALQMKKAVHQHGAQLIVVDPRRVEMTDHAALWLQQRPGTDVPVFSAMAQVILQEGLENRAFIDSRTEDFDEFAASMQPFTPEYAQGLSGVPAQKIREAARLFAKAERGAIFWALGIPEHTHGVDNAFSLINLALLCGQIGRRGTGLNPLRGQNNVQGASDAGAMPWHYPGYQPVDAPEVRAKFETAWGSAPPDRKGLSTPEIVQAAGRGEIKLLYIMGENPMMSEPDLHHAGECLSRLEFLVVQDLFINETGALADVILPACSWAEKDGTFTNTDRRVQRVRKAIEPVGESRPDWLIIPELAKRLQARLKRPISRAPYEGWDYEHPAQILAEMGSLVPEYGGITYERLESEGIQWPARSAQDPGTPYLFASEFPRGKGRFHPLVYVPSLEEADEQYPFILTTGRVLYHWHGGTLTRHSSLDHLFPQAIIEVNPYDAGSLGIRDGEPARLVSRRGEVVAQAFVTERVGKGIVFMPFHFVEAAANLLTSGVLDERAKIPGYKVSAVRLEAVSTAGASGEKAPAPDRTQPTL
ncbi:MAG: formate dehydrogenase subunit alpha [Anaerolineales bacterium]|jgi:formate dehydrogenase alpha subunit